MKIVTIDTHGGRLLSLTSSLIDLGLTKTMPSLICPSLIQMVLHI